LASRWLPGWRARALRIPPIVGYLLAGVMIGPATPGFVADLSLAGQLAEIGVMLLMFGVGVHFSLGDLLAVNKDRPSRRGDPDGARHGARHGGRHSVGMERMARHVISRTGGSR
jgi:hypothetical protein